jgi:translation initiation factor 3 subunit A
VTRFWQINLIDICVQNNNTVALKENLSKFRNYFQHQSMTLLESVFRYLIKETKQIMTDIEKSEGTQKICSLLTDDMSSGLP